MSEKRSHCTFTDGIVDPCYALEEVCDANWMEKRKGVFVATAYRRNAEGYSLVLYGVRSGAHTKKGLMFNYCPFCRTEISACSGSSVDRVSGSEPEGRQFESGPERQHS